jgi:hypothetical protein
MAKVLNKNRDFIPDGAVFVGRPSKWGNPYRSEEGDKCLLKIRLFGK